MLAGKLGALHLVSARKAAAAGWEKSPQGLLDSLLCWFGDGRGPLRAPRRRRRLLGCTERVFGSCLARRVQEFYTSCDRRNGSFSRYYPMTANLRNTLAEWYRLSVDIGGDRRQIGTRLLREIKFDCPACRARRPLVSCQDARPHRCPVELGGFRFKHSVPY